MGTRKIGTPGPPPGLSVTEQQEQQYKISLSRGERLVLLSDGVGEEAALHCCSTMPEASAQELAQALLRQGMLAGEDDATVVVIRLTPPE